jgi:hypothetical protein
MTKTLSSIFMFVAMAATADFIGLGVLGLETQIGHGSIMNPEPMR